MTKLSPKYLHYYFFIGTEAELIKLFPVMLEFSRRKISYSIIASGQNNIAKSVLFSSYLKNKNIDIFLSKEEIKQTIFGYLVWFTKTFFKGLITLRKEMKREDSILIIHGDTLSTVMGALLGRMYRIDIAHVEAGLRSFNYFHPFPEEIDRVVTSQFVTYHFCPNEWAVTNIKKKKGIKINTRQNTLFDSLQLVMKEPGRPDILTKLGKKPFAIFVVHRQENLFNEAFLKNIIGEMKKTAKTMKCVFILHKSTKYVLEKKDLLQGIEQNKNILCTDRMTYSDFMKLMNASEFIITDGGSNQEEAYYMGKPCLILREHTERKEGLDENVILSKNNYSIIEQFIKNYKNYRKSPITVREHPSSIIVDSLTNTT